jgi:hypothetical protein
MILKVIGRRFYPERFVRQAWMQELAGGLGQRGKVQPLFAIEYVLKNSIEWGMTALVQV